MQITFRGHDLILDPTGAIFWPARSLLIVADLHLEKASAYARRGTMLPPYDTHITVSRLESMINAWKPATSVSLGDSFHDRDGPDHLPSALIDRLTALTRATRWIWVTGNHDPELPVGLGGAALPELALDGLVLRHIPTAGSEGEIAGHLHPKARARVRGRILRRPCFAVDNARIVMPALGSLTGGLNVLDPVLRSLFRGRFVTYLLGEKRVFQLPHSLLADEPGLAPSA